MDKPPKTAKGSAVQQWNDAIEQVEDDETRERLRDLHVHDRRDRREIEEIIEHEVDQDDYLPLHDAFHDLRSTFDYE